MQANPASMPPPLKPAGPAASAGELFGPHDVVRLSPRGVGAGEALLVAVASPTRDEGNAKGPARSPNTVVRGIVKQVEEQPASSPLGGLFGRQPDGSSPPRGGLFGRPVGGRNYNAHVEDEEEEEERPDSPPVSVNNAQVFKRPTVADLRRERAQLHAELDGWVRSLKFARDEFDGVIGEIRARMRVLKAVNRMQVPLRRAILGRGR
jgi:hypothetical protein